MKKTKKSTSLISKKNKLSRRSLSLLRNSPRLLKIASNLLAESSKSTS